MLKPFSEYTLEIHASVNQGLAAQILCYQGGGFVGRIDFYANAAVPVSYLWHPNGTSDPNQIYLVLAMPMSTFDAVEEILRNEKPFGLELWPSGPMFGASTNGYAGLLRSLDREPVGEAERTFALARRPAAPAKRAKAKLKRARRK